MQEEEICHAIYTSIPFQQKIEIKPEFEFMKAVGPKLVSVPEIKGWTYKVMRHQTCQGPLYVRSLSFVSVRMSSNLLSRNTEAENHHDSDDDVDDDDNDWSLKPAFGDIHESSIVINPTSSSANDSASASSSHSPGDLGTPEKDMKANTKAKQQYPMCLGFFSADIVQLHINECIDATWKPEEQLYNELMFSDDVHTTDPVESDHEIQFEDANCAGVEEKEHFSPAEVKEKVKELTRNLSANVSANARRLNVQRKTLWKDYVDFRKKPWVTKENRLRVIFVGEPAVDDGGPRRDCFAGMLVVYPQFHFFHVFFKSIYRKKADIHKIYMPKNIHTYMATPTIALLYSGYAG